MISSFISFFDSVWLPDSPNDPICGELANAKQRIPVFYIGFLSRFQKQDIPEDIDVLIIVSGPEPERSRFQNEMFQIFKTKNWSYKIITPNMVMNEHFIVNPSTKELERLINRSSLIISRGGYTTIMEMISLQKKAILLPTKGQYEQEYLAEIVKKPYLRFMDEVRLKAFLNNLDEIKSIS